MTVERDEEKTYNMEGKFREMRDYEEIRGKLRDFKLLELSEPDWCIYHAKVATRFMCGSGTYMTFQRAKNAERKKMRKVNQWGEVGLNNTFSPTATHFDKNT